VQELLGTGMPEPVALHKTLGVASILSFIALLLILLLPAIPYANSVQADLRWDELWRNNLLKQVSGFSILGLFVLGLTVSPRKRIKKLQGVGSFDTWRFIHVGFGLLVIAGLVVHTGMRFGHGLNFALMLFFTTTILLGALATAIISHEHRIGANATLLRRRAVWWHILFFWPVPIVLGLHILKSYYF
jgi:nitrite reductase (NADH) large subunit